MKKIEAPLIPKGNNPLLDFITFLYLWCYSLGCSTGVSASVAKSRQKNKTIELCDEAGNIEDPLAEEALPVPPTPPTTRRGRPPKEKNVFCQLTLHKSKKQRQATAYRLQ
jgi:hypothetical protein